MPDRFFHEGDFQDRLQLSEDEFHHLVHVMRNKENDIVELVNGRGELAKAKIEKIEKSKATLLILECEKSPKTASSIRIAIPLIRMERLEWAIEKATELGAEAFTLFPAQHSEKKQISPHQLDRLFQITISALKQCKRLYLPPLKLVSSLQEALIQDGTILFGDINPKAPSLSSWINHSNIQWISGPEKGFSPQEIDFLSKHAQGVHLHPNILRAETAPLVALSILSQKWI